MRNGNKMWFKRELYKFRTTPFSCESISLNLGHVTTTYDAMQVLRLACFCLSHNNAIVSWLKKRPNSGQKNCEFEWKCTKKI